METTAPHSPLRSRPIKSPPAGSRRGDSFPAGPMSDGVFYNFTRKLSEHVPLSQKDIELLRAACGRVIDLPARHDLVREGEKPGPIVVILDGWACRHKLLPEGARRITAFLMPGDCCDMRASALDVMEHSISTLTPARVSTIERATMETLVSERLGLARAFWWTQLVEEDTLRAWLVSMGRRDAVQRVAHLMCELYVRARNIGLTGDGRFEMPLTQATLGDALGLTAVHVNRVLRKLRLRGMMEVSAGSVSIADIGKLALLAGFDETYLHRRPRQVRAPGAESE